METLCLKQLRGTQQGQVKQFTTTTLHVQKAITLKDIILRAEREGGLFVPIALVLIVKASN